MMIDGMLITRIALLHRGQAVAIGVKGIVVSNHGGRACGNAIGHSVRPG